MEFRIFLFPFFKITLLFASGILARECIRSSWIVVTVCALILASTWLLLTYLGTFRLVYRLRWLHSVASAIVVLSVGCLHAHYCQEKTLPSLPDLLTSESRFVLSVDDLPSQRKKSVRLFGHLECAIDSDKIWSVPNIGIVIYLEPDSLGKALSLLPGDRLMIDRENVRPVSQPKNPGEFDYAAFLKRRGYQVQTYLIKDQWLQVSRSSPSLYAWTQIHRKRLLRALAGLPERERAVAGALLLGYKDHLDEETRDAYARSGALHILAVSGLHVGIIYLMLNKALWFLMHIRFGRTLRVLLLIAGLWGYALITGLPPSVLRAATMFSVIAIGSHLRKPNSVYHNVMISAFILLGYNPNYLFDVGFQLSYAAVLGIISWQPHIYRWFSLKIKLLDYAWQIVSVSLAAQLAVLPLSLFYFHQLPLLFPITNLVVIPAASIIIFGGLALLLSTAVGGQIESFVTREFVDFLAFVNDFVNSIGQLEFAAISNLRVSHSEAQLLTVIILSTTLFFIHRIRICFWLGFFSTLLMLALTLVEDLKERSHTTFAVFSTTKLVTFGWTTSETAILVSNASDKEDLSFSTSGYFQNHGFDFDAVQFYPLDSLKRTVLQEPNFRVQWPLVQVGQHLLQFHDQDWKPVQVDYHIICDYKLRYAISENEENLIFTSNIWPDGFKDKKLNFAKSFFVQARGAFVIETD